MIRPTLASCIPLLVAAGLQAGEVTVDEQPFLIEAVFNASVMPETPVHLLAIDAKTWTDFRFATLAPHGSSVPQDGLLAGFDPATIDPALEDARQAVASDSLALARAEAALKTLVETSPHQLETARREAAIAREEHTYFTKFRRYAEEETAAQALERARQNLENQQEELKQLTKMYAADDLTEETEEIILIRQKDAVAAADFAMRMQSLQHKRTLEVTMPREAVTLANAERDTAIALRTAETEIPRSIEIARLELETLKTTLARKKQTLAELQHDRTLFELKAPAAGVFYHGAIEHGRWTTGKPLEALVTNGTPPARRPFATLIPADATLGLTAFVDETTARQLSPGLTATASFPGREDIEIPLALADISTTPEPDRTHRARFTATWPEDFSPAPGATAEVRLITYQKPAANLVPTKALSRDERGWTVEIRLADGKTEHRPVKRGRVSKDQTEILSGLEIGQVILSP